MCTSLTRDNVRWFGSPQSQENGWTSGIYGKQWLVSIIIISSINSSTTTWWWSFIWFIHLIKWIYFNSWVHCSATVCMCCHLELNYVLFYYSLLFIHSGQGLTANMVTSLDGPLQHMWRQKHSHLNVSVLFSKLLYIYLLQHHLKWKQFIISGLQRRV